MKDKRCVICGFNRGVTKHHIIKRRIGGSDEEENLVCLCPNHHWLGDFGTDEERVEVIRLIKEETGKQGKEIGREEREILDKKIRVLEEEYLCGIPFGNSFGIRSKPFNNLEWEKHKKTWNYEQEKKMLLGRGCSEIQCSLLHRRAEILILIRKLKKELEGIRL